MMELLTSAEMGEADRLTIAHGTTGIELMENAGRAVADNVCARHPPGSRVAVVTGPGNNGGDGLIAARLLRERGYLVRACYFSANMQRFKGDALIAAQRWNGAWGTRHARGGEPSEVVSMHCSEPASTDGRGRGRDMIDAPMNISASMPSICRAESTGPPGR